MLNSGRVARQLVLLPVGAIVRTEISIFTDNERIEVVDLAILATERLKNNVHKKLLLLGEMNVRCFIRDKEHVNTSHR
jgi:hypothetical protein